MKSKGVTLDDLAESIYDLGAMMSTQIGELRGMIGNLEGEVGTIHHEISTLRGDVHELKDAMYDVRHDIRDLQIGQREHNQRLSSLEGEMQATRNDIKELYGMVAA